MARKKNKTVAEDTAVEEVETVEIVKAEKPTKDTPYEVKKLIRNPLKLSIFLTLNDFEPYTLKKVHLENEIFMEHIDKLISLKKLERV